MLIAQIIQENSKIKFDNVKIDVSRPLINYF